MKDPVPERIPRLDRVKARKRVLAEIAALGLMETEEAQRHATRHSDTSETAYDQTVSTQ